MATKTKFAVVALLTNGREVRLNRESGKFEVQPKGDNYWQACDTLRQAYGVGDPALAADMDDEDWAHVAANL